MAGGIKLNLKGFEKMLESIQEAGGNLDNSAQRAIKAAAEITEKELRNEATASGVPSDITSKIRSTTTTEGGRYEASVGWEMKSYNPKDPDAGHIAAFLNYGTVRRVTRKGYNRGAIQGRQFISRAKRKARPKVKALQQEIFKKALEGLSK